jgi:hypothetical protein
MTQHIIRNKNLQIGREDDGQFAITTAPKAMEVKAERRQREAEIVAENAAWAAEMGIDEADLRGLFA